MQKFRNLFALGAMLACVAACGGGGGGADAPANPADAGAEGANAPLTMPVYRVVGPAVTKARFAVLAKALSLPAQALDPSGFVRYTDSARFLDVPGAKYDVQGNDEEQAPFEARALDFDALQQLVVPDEKTVRERGEGALREAGLLPDLKSPYRLQLDVTHARFQAVDKAGNQVADVALDTQLDGRFYLGNVPVVGPGAALKLAFGPDEALTHATFALRDVAEDGQVEIMSARDAEAHGAEVLRGLADNLGAGLDLQSTLVYFAPDLEQAQVQRLLPHYVITGAFILPDGTTAPLRKMVVPALRARLLVSLSADLRGRDVTASAGVVGGRAPYRYAWTSSSRMLPSSANGDTLMYEVGAGRADPFTEILTLTVTDADGLVVTTSRQWAAIPPLGLDDEIGGPSTLGRREYGVEYIGDSQGLPRAGTNARGFRERMQRDDPGARSRFFYGDFAAWERDFKDTDLGGNDRAKVDAVDITFYTGHANGDFWTFPGMRDDGTLHFSDASYGEGDLEWLVIAACGPLQDVSSGQRWWQRWGPAFNGLHHLMGYQTVTWDNVDEGRKMAQYMLRGDRVRDAWFQAAFDTQGPDEIVAVIGAWGPGGLSNLWDHWHGKGTVGPDIRDPRGFWIITSSC